MSERIDKNIHFLLFFIQSKPRQRAQLLKIIGKEQFLSLLEIGANCLVGNLNIPDSCRRKLKRKRNVFRTLSFDKRKGWKSKRDLIHKSQTGGMLGALAAAAGSFLVQRLLSSIFPPSRGTTAVQERDKNLPSPPVEKTIQLA